MEQVLKEVPSDILVFGNLDPVGVFKMGNPQSIHDATIQLLKKTEGYSNFVISSGCDTPPGVEIENITAFFDAVNNFNESKTA
jgi:uroporphyrinogen decarboxylase